VAHVADDEGGLTVAKGKWYGSQRSVLVDHNQDPLGIVGNPIVAVVISGAGVRSVGFTRGLEYVTSLGSEELLYQETVDFPALDPSITVVRCAMTALTRQAPGPGVYFIRVGGTAGIADGTIFATLVTTHNGGYVSTPDAAIGPPLPRPVGAQIVKVTGASGVPGVLAFIKATSVSFF